MLRVQGKSIILALILWAASRSVGYPFDGALNESLYPPSQTDGIQDNNRTFINTFSKNLNLAFQKTLTDKHPLLSLYYRDLSTNAGSTYEMSDHERNSESRLLTRQALARALQDTVNDVNLLYTVKEYGRAMTSAHLRVKDGNMSLEGPSLDHVGNHSDPSPREELRSSLLLINNAHFGLTFRTTFGSIQSNLTYFLAGHDLLGASLEKELSKQTRLILEYRLAPNNEDRALLSLQLPFEY